MLECLNSTLNLEISQGFKFHENRIKIVAVTVPSFFRQYGRHDVTVRVKFLQIWKLTSKNILIEIQKVLLSSVMRFC